MPQTSAGYNATPRKEPARKDQSPNRTATSSDRAGRSPTRGPDPITATSPTRGRPEKPRSGSCGPDGQARRNSQQGSDAGIRPRSSSPLPKMSIGVAQYGGVVAVRLSTSSHLKKAVAVAALNASLKAQGRPCTSRFKVKLHQECVRYVSSARGAEIPIPQVICLSFQIATFINSGKIGSELSDTLKIQPAPSA